MKKLLATLMTFALLFSAISMILVTPVTAAATTCTVYISDAGSDSNTGLSADAPVKTWTHAGELFTANGSAASDWKAVVVGTSTYAQSEGWYFMNISAAATAKPTVITGNTPDAKFNFTRTSMVVKKDLTFRNVQFTGNKEKISVDTGCAANITYIHKLYISDSGVDTNDGLTAETPIKTWIHAGELFTANGSTANAWEMVVVGTSTYAQSEGWYFMNISAAASVKPMVITGNTPDAKFNFTRSSMVVKKDLTFRDILFTGTKANISVDPGCTANITFPVPVDTLYISDSGLDTNDGLSAETPVKTWKHAGEILSAKGATAALWTVVVVGTSSYTADEPWAMMNLSSTATAKPMIIRGYTSDAVFNVTRGGGAAFVYDVTFRDIQIGGNKKIGPFNANKPVITLPQSVYMLGAQMKNGTTAGSEDTDVRLIAVIDSLDTFVSAGFVLSRSNSAPEIGGENVSDKKLTEAYASILADGQTLTATPGTYYIAVSVDNIPNANFGTTVYARAYGIDAQGTVTYTDTVSFTVTGLLG